MADRNRLIEPLIFASLKGESTPSEEERLEAWRQAAAENEQLYQETVRLWEVMGGAYQADQPGPPPIAAELVRSAGVKPIARQSDTFATRYGHRWWVGAAAAAAAVLVVGLALREVRQRGKDRSQFGADEFVTGAGETATVSLRDGTVIRLAPSSRLVLASGSSSREISFQGRAYFAVARDEAHPFRIRTPAGDVSVLGTRFDVQARENDLRLVVVEGRVALSARGEQTVVQKGELGRVLDGVTVPAVKVPDADTTIDWVGNFVAFQSTPLRDVVAEIMRRYAVRIEIADSAVSGRTVSGWFAERSHEAILRVICTAVLAECLTQRDGSVVMKSK